LRFIHEQLLNILSANTRRPHMPLVVIHQAKGGMWVDITYDYTLPRIILRADVDALPIQEATGLPFASRNSGVMHACGHDTHAAMLLGAFKTLVENDLPTKHNLRLVFQRAEENPIDGRSGGKTLVEEGVLDGISAAYALHIWATGEPGVFLSRPGPMLANSDRFKITVTCTGGHVAFPHRGSNAIDIATDIHVALRGFDTRFLGPNEPTSFVPAISNAGTGSNIRPSEAEIWYAVRNVLGPKTRAAFHQAISEQVKAVVSRYPDATVACEPIYGHPALANSPASYEHVNAVLQAAGEKTGLEELHMGGEDFAHYLELQGGVPGSMWLLGAAQEGSGDHHTPTFNPDESVFWRGVMFWLLLATSD
ncbi:MAG: amidohydrolase, partial [Parcubacteria group bacterium]|nr:amidohydrolase [Parcubacteria group bacterium]